MDEPVRRTRPSAVVVGAGPVGRSFAVLLEGTYDVGTFDTVAVGAARRGDATAPDGALLDALGGASVVVLALPESVLLSALQACARAAPDALLVETASVKGPLEAIKAQLQHEVLGINPMFAPSLGFSGRPVAVTRHRAGEAAAAFEALLSASGARLTVLDGDRHDRLTASLQALTHAAVLAFADALAHSDASLNELLPLAPPPFRTMLMLAARITSQSPETYWDIQAANPHASGARQRLRDGVARYDAQPGGMSRDAFSAWIGQIRRRLGDTSALEAQCARMFAASAAPYPPCGPVPSSSNVDEMRAQP